LYAMLVSNAPFFQNILGFCAAFNMWYSPSLQDDVGRLVCISEIDDAAVDVEIDNVTLTGSTSPPRLAVPVGVEVQGVPSIPLPPPAKLKNDERLRSLLAAGSVRHPPDCEGVVLSIPCPHWLARPPSLAPTAEDDVVKPVQRRFRRPGGASAAVSEQIKIAHLRKMSEFAKIYAENSWKNYQLGGASVSVTAPLTLHPNLRPGYPVRMKLKGGGTFTGVVQSIAHRADASQSSPTEQTLLTLTYLR